MCKFWWWMACLGTFYVIHDASFNHVKIFLFFSLSFATLLICNQDLNRLDLIEYAAK